MAQIEDFFKGCDQSQVQEAMRRAKILSENPQVQEAFSRVDKKEIIEMLRNLTEVDKNKLMRTFLDSKNRELMDLIRKLK